MSFYPQSRARAALSGGLLGKVFGLLAFSLMFAVVGGWVGARVVTGGGMLMLLVVAEFGLIFGIHRAREKEGLNMALLYAFTFVSGMTIGPIIASYIGAGMGVVVLQAVATTAAMTVGLSAYALTTRRRFAGAGPYLFAGLIGLVVMSLLSLFIGGSVLSVVIGFLGAMLFSALLVYDVQRAKTAQDTMGNAVVITLGIYLDIVNLFLYILRILSYLQCGGRRS